MTRTLYLHIGSHRTAMTSIQLFLLDNFLPLIQNGCLLPLRKPRHFELLNSIFSGARSVDDVAHQLHERADSKAPGADIQRVILSDEDVCTRADISALKGFRDHFDVKVIYSLRRQDLWLESWYFQNIKWQWNPLLSHCTFEEFLTYRDDFHWIDYDRYVRHLEEVFALDNIILTVFEDEQMPDGPVSEFCRITGNEAIVDPDKEPRLNASMSAEMVEFMRHLPMGELEPPARELLRRSLEKVDRTVLGHDSSHCDHLMSLDLRQDILSQYKDGNRALAQRYFNRDDLFLQALPDADAAVAQSAIPEHSEDLLAKFVVPLLRQLSEDGLLSQQQNTPPKKG